METDGDEGESEKEGVETQGEEDETKRVREKTKRVREEIERVGERPKRLQNSPFGEESARRLLTISTKGVTLHLGAKSLQKIIPQEV